MVLSRVRLIRVKLVLVNLNSINDTYIHCYRSKLKSVLTKKYRTPAARIPVFE